MIQSELEHSVNNQLEICRNLLVSKNGSYNTSTDRLASFKKASALRGVTPREALAGMMLKHTVSIYDLCAESATAPVEIWEEKISDHINYLLLLRALVDEEQSTFKQIER